MGLPWCSVCGREAESVEEDTDILTGDVVTVARCHGQVRVDAESPVRTEPYEPQTHWDLVDLSDKFPIIVHPKHLRDARKTWPGVAFDSSLRLDAGRRRLPGRAQRRRARRRAKARERRDRLREIQLSQRRPGRGGPTTITFPSGVYTQSGYRVDAIDGGRVTMTRAALPAPGTWSLGDGVTMTIGEGTVV